jgi:16S rRNA processing protein RimM
VFEGFSSREDIEKIRSGLIQIPESERITLPEGEYFQSDLIGLEVYQLGGAYLGSIVDVIETGVNDLFVVKDGSREVLIPALWRIVKGINLEQNRMEVDPPEGLLDL